MGQNTANISRPKGAGITSFARGVGIGVGVGVAKQVMKAKSGEHEQSSSEADKTATTAGIMMAPPVANTRPATPQPQTKPSDPVDDGKTVCVAGCYK